jgi:hypothetical protein
MSGQLKIYLIKRGMRLVSIQLGFKDNGKKKMGKNGMNSPVKK